MSKYVNVFSEFIKGVAQRLNITYGEAMKKFETSKALQKDWKNVRGERKELFVPIRTITRSSAQNIGAAENLAFQAPPDPMIEEQARALADEPRQQALAAQNEQARLFYEFNDRRINTRAQRGFDRENLQRALVLGDNQMVVDDDGNMWGNLFGNEDEGEEAQPPQYGDNPFAVVAANLDVGQLLAGQQRRLQAIRAEDERQRLQDQQDAIIRQQLLDQRLADEKMAEDAAIAKQLRREARQRKAIEDAALKSGTPAGVPTGMLMGVKAEIDKAAAKVGVKLPTASLTAAQMMPLGVLPSTPPPIDLKAIGQVPTKDISAAYKSPKATAKDAPDWTEHVSTSTDPRKAGQTFYVNTKTGVSQWERPAGFGLKQNFIKLKGGKLCYY